MPAPTDVEYLLSAEAVARQLDVRPETVLDWARADPVTGERRFLAPTYIGRTPRWRLADVNAWIAARAAAPDEIEATATRKRKRRG